MREGNAAFLRQTELGSEKRLRRSRPQANDHLRLDHFRFRLQPRLAGAHFSDARFVMQPPLPTFPEFKVLDSVSHINLDTLDGRVGENTVQDFARGTDKRMTLDILFITGLLAHQRHTGHSRTFAKDRLRRIQI